MKRILKLSLLTVALVAVAGLLSACAGRSIDPTNVTHNSATLRAEVDTTGVSSEAEVFFRYRRAFSGDAWTHTPTNESTINGNILSQPVSGLAPQTEYEYEVCGRPNRSVNVGCNQWDVDGDGTRDQAPATHFTTAAAPPTTGDPVVIGEDQGWQTGGTVQTVNDSHLHVAVVSGLKPFDRLMSARNVTVRITTHNNPTPVDYVRWSCESDIKQRVDIDWAASGTATKDVTLRVDPALCPDGVRELRFTANRSTGEREFTTSRFPVLFDRDGNGGGSHYGTTPGQILADRFVPSNAGRCGGGAWYPANEYNIAFIDCRDYYDAMYGGWERGQQIRVRSQDGRGVVVLNPNFHGGNWGRQIGSFAANTWTTVTIPTDVALGPLAFHFRSISPADPEEAGVHVVKTTLNP